MTEQWDLGGGADAGDRLEGDVDAGAVPGERLGLVVRAEDVTRGVGLGPLPPPVTAVLTEVPPAAAAVIAANGRRSRPASAYDRTTATPTRA